MVRCVALIKYMSEFASGFGRDSLNFHRFGIEEMSTKLAYEQNKYRGIHWSFCVSLTIGLGHTLYIYITLWQKTQNQALNLFMNLLHYIVALFSDFSLNHRTICEQLTKPINIIIIFFLFLSDQIHWIKHEHSQIFWTSCYSGWFHKPLGKCFYASIFINLCRMPIRKILYRSNIVPTLYSLPESWVLIFYQQSKYTFNIGVSLKKFRN